MKIKTDTKIALDSRETGAFLHIMALLWNHMTCGDIEEMGIQGDLDFLCNKLDDLGLIPPVNNDRSVMWRVKGSKDGGE